MVFNRLSEEETLTYLHRTRFQINFLDEEICRIFDNIKKKSLEMQTQKNKVYKALARL